MQTSILDKNETGESLDLLNLSIKIAIHIHKQTFFRLDDNS